VEDDAGKKMTMQRHRALSSRFISRGIELLNTKVAKNWSRFDQFHELLYTFALADVEDVLSLLKSHAEAKNGEEEQAAKHLPKDTKAARIGLEFFFKAKFVEKACDFMLGKKSPLCRPNESRPEIGGPYAHPDLSSVIKLMIAMITDEELLAQYPMSDSEKQMILHHDLLKTMLGQATVSKQFG
jgi:hypothetical protein